MATQKIYRKAHEGPTAGLQSLGTKIVLTRLECNTTEDNAGMDECELRIWADNNFQSHRKDMDNGQTWDLNIQLEFSYRVKIQLLDLDSPGFPSYDDHDLLGTVIINPDQTQGSGVFSEDGADYRIDYKIIILQLIEICYGQTTKKEYRVNEIQRSTEGD